MITIRIDTTPKAKGRPKFNPKTGHAYTDAATRAYEETLAGWALAEMASNAPLEGPLHVHVTAFMPIPRSWSKKKQASAIAGQLQHTSTPDIDNLQKAVFDAFNGIVWKDDCQIVEATVVKRYSSSPALVVVARAA